jgi:hypothetical protein
MSYTARANVWASPVKALPLPWLFAKYSSTEFCDQFPLSSPRRKPGSSLFLDSGFRRNDVWEHPTHFGHLFVTSCLVD